MAIISFEIITVYANNCTVLVTDRRLFRVHETDRRFFRVLVTDRGLFRVLVTDRGLFRCLVTDRLYAKCQTSKFSQASLASFLYM